MIEDVIVIIQHNLNVDVVDNEASKMKSICAVCGHEFIKKNPNQVFCSKSCASHVKVHKKKEDMVQLKQVAYYVDRDKR